MKRHTKSGASLVRELFLYDRSYKVAKFVKKTGILYDESYKVARLSYLQHRNIASKQH